MSRRATLASLVVASVALTSFGLTWLAAVSRAAELDFATLAIQRYDPPKPAPDFALPALDGRTVRLRDLQGKVVLLFFWTTW